MRSSSSVQDFSASASRASCPARSSSGRHHRRDGGARARCRGTRRDAVINCAGKTGRPNVDWCETHQPETYRANVVGALTLADACAAEGAYLLHLGSGCIFYGPSPHPGGWREDDFANPTAFYSRTKYAADLVLSRLPNVGIARLRMPIDGVPGVAQPDHQARALPRGDRRRELRHGGGRPGAVSSRRSSSGGRPASST